jgi:hypothetical protein
MTAILAAITGGAHGPGRLDFAPNLHQCEARRCKPDIAAIAKGRKPWKGFRPFLLIVSSFEKP